MKEDQIESLVPIALLAMRESGANGFVLSRRIAGTERLERIYEYGGGENWQAVSLPLRVNEAEAGKLTYYFGPGDEARAAREILELAARAVESIWSMDRAPCALVQLASTVGRLQSRLADLKIAERARGFLANPRNDAVAIIAKHVEEVIKTHRLAAQLEQMARDLENQVAERKLIARAKELLQSTQGLTEEQAYTQLRKSSRRSRRRMAAVAQQFIEGGRHAQSN